MPRSSYPFKSNYQNGYNLAKLRSDFNPRGLSVQDMDKIKEFVVDCPTHLEQPLRYFLLSYYCRGMSFVDMANLAWQMIYNGRITYRRSKSNSLISIAVSEPLSKVLEYFHGQHPVWVIPVLSEFHKTAMQKKNRIKKCLKIYNRALKEIQATLGIETDLSSYTARHTYAKVLRQNGFADTVISSGLGHMDVKTTRHYLERLGFSEVDKADLTL